MAAYLILKDKNKILLLKRANTGFQDGKYSLVAGHIESDETPAQAAIREAKEEAGIDISLQDVEVVHIMYRQRASENDVPYVDFYLTCDKWLGEIENKEPEKCAELRWVPVEELPPEIIPYIAQAIESINRKLPHSEFGW